MMGKLKQQILELFQFFDLIVVLLFFSYVYFSPILNTDSLPYLVFFPIALTLLTKTKWLNYAVLIGFIFLALLDAMVYQYQKIYHSLPIDYEVFFALLQTSSREALDFYKDHFSFSIFLLLIFLVGGVFVVSTKTKKNLIFIIPAIMITYLLKPLGIKDTLGFRFARDFSRYYEEYNLSLNAYKKTPEFKDIDFDKNSLDLGSFSGLYIIVIGESQTKNLMNVYGYPRKNTPYLSNADNGWVFFYDVISSHSHTVPSLLNALTLTDHRAIAKTNKISHYSIVDILKEFDVHTSWVSNQAEYGIWDNPISVIAKRADESKWISKQVGTFDKKYKLDNDLLPDIKRYLEKNRDKKKRVLFVHLWGSHGNYCDNVPKDLKDYKFKIPNDEKRVFGNMKGDDCYDLTVLNTDRVLKSIIELAQKEKDYQATAYFSDHGENPILGTFHNIMNHSKWHIDIPFAFHFNDSTNNKYAMNSRLIQRNSFSLDDFIPTFLDMMTEGDYTYAIAPKKSFFKKEGFRRLNSRFDMGEVSKHGDYLENSMALRKLSPLKNLFAHRVNSLMSLQEAAQVFTGVELDVRFRDDNFYVYHSADQDVGLTLKEYFETGVKVNNKLKYWLDFKLDNGFDERSFDRQLLSIIDSNKFTKDQLYLEFPSKIRSPILKKLVNNGYQTSYYVPTHALQTCEKSGDCSDVLKAIKADLLKHSYRYMSFDTHFLDILAPLDPFLKEEGIGKLAWDLKIKSGEYQYFDQYKVKLRRFHEREIDVLLVNFPSIFDL